MYPGGGAYLVVSIIQTPIPLREPHELNGHQTSLLKRLDPALRLPSTLLSSRSKRGCRIEQDVVEERVPLELVEGRRGLDGGEEMSKRERRGWGIERCLCTYKSRTKIRARRDRGQPGCPREGRKQDASRLTHACQAQKLIKEQPSMSDLRPAKIRLRASRGGPGEGGGCEVEVREESRFERIVLG